LFKPVEKPETGSHGTRLVTVYEATGEEMLIKGPAYDPKGRTPDHLDAATGAFALTHGIPRAFWEAWLEQNKDSDLVKSRHLFACAEGDDASIKAETKDLQSHKTGLEPLIVDSDPRKMDPRIQRDVGRRAGIIGIGTADTSDM
jgi:hypothetical protein